MGLKKVLITGGAGFIGYHLTKKLLDLGMEVIIYDNFVNYTINAVSHYLPYLNYRLNDIQDRACIVRGDIRDRGYFAQVLKEHGPEVVVHLAAIPIAKAANQFSDEAVQINLNGTINLLECLRNSPVTERFVYISSSCVYGDFHYEPADEYHPLNPIDVYGGTKLSSEILTRSFGTRFGIEHVIVRPSAVYGPTDANRRVTQIMIENAIQGKPLVLFNAGLDRVDFTYVDDAVAGIALAALGEQAKNETFNITQGSGKSILDLVEVLRTRFPDLRVIEKPQDERRPSRGTLAIGKAEKMLGYAPAYDLGKGINAYLDFLLNNERLVNMVSG
jgi:nucleoside-diphosphate-sugar epimerase